MNSDVLIKLEYLDKLLRIDAVIDNKVTERVERVCDSIEKDLGLTPNEVVFIKAAGLNEAELASAIRKHFEKGGKI